MNPAQKLRTCEACGEPYARNPKETKSKYAQRRYCSRACITLAARANVPMKACKHCKEPLVMRDDEKPSAFRKREYCSKACFYSSRAENPTNQYTNAPRKRNDRGITFSTKDHAPMSLETLGKPREYPRAQPLGEPCPTHPSNTIGAYGCPACNAGQRWATRQRQTVVRPHHEGGR